MNSKRSLPSCETGNSLTVKFLLVVSNQVYLSRSMTFLTHSNVVMECYHYRHCPKEVYWFFFFIFLNCLRTGMLQIWAIAIDHRISFIFLCWRNFLHYEIASCFEVPNSVFRFIVNEHWNDFLFRCSSLQIFSFFRCWKLPKTMPFMSIDATFSRLHPKQFVSFYNKPLSFLSFPLEFPTKKSALPLYFL